VALEMQDDAAEDQTLQVEGAAERQALQVGGSCSSVYPCSSGRTPPPAEEYPRPLSREQLMLPCGDDSDSDPDTAACVRAARNVRRSANFQAEMAAMARRHSTKSGAEQRPKWEQEQAVEPAATKPQRQAHFSGPQPRPFATAAAAAPGNPGVLSEANRWAELAMGAALEDCSTVASTGVSPLSSDGCAIRSGFLSDSSAGAAWVRGGGAGPQPALAEASLSAAVPLQEPQRDLPATPSRLSGCTLREVPFGGPLPVVTSRPSSAVNSLRPPALL